VETGLHPKVATSILLVETGLHPKVATSILLVETGLPPKSGHEHLARGNRANSPAGLGCPPPLQSARPPHPSGSIVADIDPFDRASSRSAPKAWI
jgi:hypothetical protein